MNERDYIEALSIPEPNSGCWLWLGVLSGSGYGYASFHVRESAHRMSYKAFNGPIPPGLLVRHTCDVPTCVNPAHLLLGTNQDNSDDKIRRGRAVGHKGERHWKAALSAKQVAAIRADPRRQGEIAAAYGIRQQAVSKIKRGENWRHI